MLSDVRRHGDRIPRDAAAAVALVEKIGSADLAGFDVTGVRIPFGDQTLGEGYLHGKSGLTWGIEIEDGSFHADCAAEARLEIGFAKVFDEIGKIGGSILREPFYGLAISAGDGGEGAPFVSCEIGSDVLRADSAGQGEGEKREGGGAGDGWGHGGALRVGWLGFVD